MDASFLVTAMKKHHLAYVKLVLPTINTKEHQKLAINTIQVLILHHLAVIVGTLVFFLGITLALVA